MRKETILNVFPSSGDGNRLVIAVEQEPEAGSRLVLRQESFADDVGWFVQSRIAIEPEQVAGLRMALSGQESVSRLARAPKMSRLPAILRFDGASSGHVG